MYKIEGNNEYLKKEFSNAIYFYTEGIKVNCRDDELNAKLYTNRATAHFYLGEIFLSVSLALYLSRVINNEFLFSILIILIYYKKKFLFVTRI